MITLAKGALATLVAGVTALSAATASAAPAPSSASPGGRATISMAVKSKLAPVTSDVFVLYRLHGKDQAVVSGRVSNAASGEVVRLYAKRFPFTSGWAQVGKSVK